MVEKQALKDAGSGPQADQASIKMLDETRALLDAWPHPYSKAFVKNGFPHGQDDVLVDSPAEYWRKTPPRTFDASKPAETVPERFDPLKGIDIYQKLHLKDPAKSSMFDLLPLQHAPGESKIASDSSELTDATAYAKAAQDLFKRGSIKGSLSEAALEGMSHDLSIPVGERAVAASVRANYSEIKQGYFSFLRDLKKDDIDFLSKTAEIKNISRAETSLHNPGQLADAATSLLKKHGGPLSEKQLADDAADVDGKLTGKNRAAAELLLQNFGLFSSIDGKDGISKDDISALADELWWGDVVDESIINRKQSGFNAGFLKGSHKAAPPLPEENTVAPKDAECHAVSDGITYGATAYAVTALMGSKNPGGWAIATGTAQAVISQAECVPSIGTELSGHLS